MDRRWFVGLALALILPLGVAACGRVDLQDLTPEAVQTQEAEARLTQTAIAGTIGLGDPVRGNTQWGTWCVGCHAEGGAGQGPDIRGEIYNFDEISTAFREEGAPLPSGNPHPITYQTFDLSDEDFRNIFAYLAQQSR